jgi:hypothetical protein
VAEAPKGIVSDDLVATLLGAYSLTLHAAQCSHGTEFDEFYRREPWMPT